MMLACSSVTIIISTSERIGNQLATFSGFKPSLIWRHSRERKRESENERKRKRERETAWVLGYSLCCAIEFHTIWGSKWHVNHEQRPACFFTTELNTGGVREIIRPLRRARQENSRGAEDSETLKGLPRAPLNSQSGAHTHTQTIASDSGPPQWGRGL